MPPTRYPCIQCKGDDGQPKCIRCQKKDLPCFRPKNSVFRHNATARFDKGQKWVSGSAQIFRVQTATTTISGEASLSPDTTKSLPSLKNTANSSPCISTDVSPTRSPYLAVPVEIPQTASGALSSPHNATVPEVAASWPLQRPSLAPISLISSVSSNSRGVGLPGIASLTQSVHRPTNEKELRPFPLQDVKEACLLRYFTEEISQWFDLCDESRHFQLVVPHKARQHPHLLNAIFAVSSRHLARLPQYQTPHGILYQGEHLERLKSQDAVEYMLECLPAFRRFHESDDDDFRESIITTAVILRQLEEIDDDDANGETEATTGQDDAAACALHEKQINFMPIINAVLRETASQAMLSSRSLIQAAYWFALRQEIYHSFTRRMPPQLVLPPEYWQGASNVNKTVMHTVQVAKWHWGRGTNEEFLRLMNQQRYLEDTVLATTKPMWEKPADKSKGEIFPTIWYNSHIELTSIQQSLMARSVLVSENPYYKELTSTRRQNLLSSRASWRTAEKEVRFLMLNLCGLALCHPASAPALVNAAIGIQLYGDFFTDPYERAALRGVVERYRDAHAWPVRRLMEMFT